MCTAGTFGALSIGGAATSAIGAIGSAQVQKIALNSQSDQASMQGRVAQIQAQSQELNAQTVAKTANLNADAIATTARINASSVSSVSAMNAELSEDQAQAVLLSAQRAEENLYLKAGLMKGAQRAHIAASGIDLGSPTALNILTTTDVMAEADVNTISSNAIRQAFGYRMQEMNYTNEGIMARAAAQSTAESARGQAEVASISALAKGKSTALMTRAQGSTYSAQAFQYSSASEALSPFSKGSTSLLSSAASVGQMMYLNGKNTDFSNLMSGYGGINSNTQASFEASRREF